MKCNIVLFKEWKNVVTRRVKKIPDYKVGDAKPLYMPREAKRYPEYKYGESNIFQQSNKGLYGGSFIQFGHHVAENGIKTPKTWLPNIIKKRLWSETLGRDVEVKLTTKVLKTISKEGGLDKYLLKDKSARIKELGPFGWKLRYDVLKKMEDEKRKTTDPHEGKSLTENGDRVYYEDEKYRVIVGRRKLMKLLYPLEKERIESHGKQLHYRDFVDRYRQVGSIEMFYKLEQYGFEIGNISICK
ncbi:hypothetical protein TBLA_0A02350 [Henningerozyma blattae CBS 6284]|uniref:Large ribosomal subunit protein bL28m n=1 Tax=Henningerozyma blattae (strain ATCC 34711 / CBS 6284 / DSM 70876 / NBRC 10599 / NRRL Y-10934 / UCD 77-7) TaxID=1071380 RepID=I2GV82_HENB6|nr:hypothetical protein TBLA_0A02350 [Tetrapisispora blattae CBS 6284]CCH58034.1 hypothetical protein TBLA_0A02350 [Tetrapisispora blattae CBS 6284]